MIHWLGLRPGAHRDDGNPTPAFIIIVYCLLLKPWLRLFPFTLFYLQLGAQADEKKKRANYADGL